MASPSRLVPNTTALMAMPGKITSQGAVRTYSAADSESMRPQEGCGSGTPSPRNASADFDQDGRAELRGRQHDQRRQRVGQHVVDGDARLAHADGARRLHDTASRAATACWSG